MAVLANEMRKISRQPLAFAPWQNDYPYKPDVLFAMAYNNENIFLQYDVAEKTVQAAEGKINAPVYQDSCVEFFITLDEGATYYNFEFNCIGTVLGGFGKGKNGRAFLPQTVLEQIRFQSLVRKEKGYGLVSWQLTVAIPLEVFVHHPLSSLKRKQCRANFYKCGDHLPEPHFLSWANIEGREPNFHLPQFFGTLVFA